MTDRVRTTVTATPVQVVPQQPSQTQPEQVFPMPPVLQFQTEGGVVEGTPLVPFRGPDGQIQYGIPMRPAGPPGQPSHGCGGCGGGQQGNPGVTGPRGMPASALPGEPGPLPEPPTPLPPKPPMPKSKPKAPREPVQLDHSTDILRYVTKIGRLGLGGATGTGGFFKGPDGYPNIIGAPSPSLVELKNTKPIMLVGFLKTPMTGGSASFYVNGNLLGKLEAPSELSTLDVGVEFALPPGHHLLEVIINLGGLAVTQAVAAGWAYNIAEESNGK